MDKIGINLLWVLWGMYIIYALGRHMAIKNHTKQFRWLRFLYANIMINRAIKIAGETLSPIIVYPLAIDLKLTSAGRDIYINEGTKGLANYIDGRVHVIAEELMANKFRNYETLMNDYCEKEENYDKMFPESPLDVNEHEQIDNLEKDLNNDTTEKPT